MKGLLKLFIYSFILFIFFAFIGPRFVSFFPEWVAFNKVQEDLNIHSGALYYSDVPITKEAEAATRAGVKKGMELRQSKGE